MVVLRLNAGLAGGSRRSDTSDKTRRREKSGGVASLIDKRRPPFHQGQGTIKTVVIYQ